MSTQPLHASGQALRLLPERAALHVATRTLFIADLHLGKSAAFRARGLPVPHGTTADNLARLASLVRDHAVTRIVFLGDLLHSKHAQSAAQVAPVRVWRDAHASLACVLVRGNHDAHAGDPPSSLAFEVVDEPWPVPGADGLVACHHPRRVDGATVLAGHWHPAITLRGPARDQQRLACFCLVDGVLVLPAFGAFTGSSPHEPPAGAMCWPVGGGQVWPGVRVDR